MKLNYKSWEQTDYNGLRYEQLYIAPFYEKKRMKNPKRKREVAEYRIDVYGGSIADHWIEFRDKMGNELFIWLFPFGSSREDRLTAAEALKDLINMSEH